MEDVKRIYLQLLHSDGLKLREIANLLTLDKYYVAEVMFSPENTSYWYQNDDSRWFAIEGSLIVEDPKEKEDDLTTPILIPKSINIDRYFAGNSSLSLRYSLSQLAHYRNYSNEETIELITRYRNGDLKAYDLLIKSYQKLVVGIARKYKKDGLLLEDLIQEGNLGLIRAIDLFDESQYGNFIHYAKNWIFQAVISFRLQQSSLVRLPLNQLSLYHKMQRLKEQFEQQNEYLVSAKDVDWCDDISDRVSEGFYKLPDDLSEQFVYTDYDDIEGDDRLIPDENLIRQSINSDTVRLTQFLTNRQRQILVGYYGLNGGVQLSLDQMGEMYRLTRERVRQIKEVAICRMRGFFIAQKRRELDSRIILNSINCFLEKLQTIERNKRSLLIEYEPKPKKEPIKTIKKKKEEPKLSFKERIDLLNKTNKGDMDLTISKSFVVNQNPVKLSKSHRPVIKDNPSFNLSTPLRQLVRLNILTEQEFIHCYDNQLWTIGDVIQTIKTNNLTHTSRRYSNYNPDIMFKIANLIEPKRRRVDLNVQNGEIIIRSNSNYNKSFQKYIQMIDKMRQATAFGQKVLAKPALLLAIIEGIEDGFFVKNHFVINDWLENKYKSLMSFYNTQRNHNVLTKIEYPFWHLQSDGFWHLVYKSGELCLKYTPTKAWMKQNNMYAFFDNELWNLLQDKDSRKQLRFFIIEHKMT